MYCQERRVVFLTKDDYKISKNQKQEKIIIMVDIDILGVNINASDRASAEKQTDEALCHRSGYAVFTPNSCMIGKCLRDEKLKSMINSAELRIPDGAGVAVASRILYGNGAISERVTGIELAETVLKRAAEKNLRVFFYGASPYVAKRAAEQMSERIGGLCICGYADGYGSEAEVVKKIADSGADIVFVCLGFPKQEMWILQNRDKLLNVRLFMALGGTFDVWSGKVRRAGKVMCKMGLEWLWRITADGFSSVGTRKKYKDVRYLVRFSNAVLSKKLKNIVGDISHFAQMKYVHFILTNMGQI